MRRHALEPHDGRRAVASSSWGTVIVAATAVALAPLAVAVVLSHPGFGAGILAGAAMSYAARNARRGSTRGTDPGATERALRPGGTRATLTERSRADG